MKPLLELEPFAHFVFELLFKNQRMSAAIFSKCPEKFMKQVTKKEDHQEVHQEFHQGVKQEVHQFIIFDA